MKYSVGIPLRLWHVNQPHIRHARGAEGPNRGRDSGVHGGRDGGRPPLQCRRVVAGIQRPLPDRPAPPRIRGLRRRAGGPDSRLGNPDKSFRNGEQRMTDATSNPLRDEIQKAISENHVILFMKGTPNEPACGFSARTVAVLQSVGQPFAAVDILPDPRIRQELSALSNWPTIPQLFVDGELVGGCDIVTEMYESGELQQALGLENGAAGEPVAEPQAPEAAPLTIENRL